MVTRCSFKQERVFGVITVRRVGLGYHDINVHKLEIRCFSGAQGWLCHKIISPTKVEFKRRYTTNSESVHVS